jgi:hypothetical protein
MRRIHLAIQATLWVAILVAPANGRAQSGEETSVWQFGMREVDWKAIERLQEEVRDYQGAGAIGAYELRIRTNGARFDAMVTAEILDAIKLAELRNLEMAESTSKEAVARNASRQRPS